MKRGLVLISIILLLAAPMASAGFFNDFFENLLDRPGNSITGYALADLLQKAATPAPTTNVAPIATAPTIPKTAAPLALPKTAIPTAITSTKPTPPQALKPSAAIAPSTLPKTAPKLIMKPSVYNLAQDKVLYITSVKYDAAIAKNVASAKLQLKLTDGQLFEIDGKWFKMEKINNRMRFTPATYPAPKLVTPSTTLNLAPKTNTSTLLAPKAALLAPKTNTSTLLAPKTTLLAPKASAPALNKTQTPTKTIIPTAITPIKTLAPTATTKISLSSLLGGQLKS